MSFRIDLTSKEGVSIYLLVINDVININFETADPSKKDLASPMRELFIHLLDAHASLEHRQDYVRGADPEHIKRHHGIKEETNIMHMHYSFDQEVTPELLEHFFDQLLIAQKSPEHSNDQFVTEAQASEIVKTFGIFYGQYKGSTLEKQSLKERELTKEEKNSLIRHAKEDPSDHLSKKDVHELEQCGFTSSEIPKPIEQPKLNTSHPLFGAVVIADIVRLSQLLEMFTQGPSDFGLFQSQERSTGRPSTSTGFFGLRFGSLVNNPGKEEEEENQNNESDTKSPFFHY